MTDSTPVPLSSEDLMDQIEELKMSQRIDQELGATLDFESVLMLTMDWALRRTGASAGMCSAISRDGEGLIPLTTLGYPPGAIPYGADHPCPLQVGLIGRTARLRQSQFVRDMQSDPDYVTFLPGARSVMAVPIELRDTLLGVLCVEGEDPETFNEKDLIFLKRLAARAAISLDHARLYRDAEQQADETAALYAASRVIFSNLDRRDTLRNAAQSLATVLKVSSVVLMDYHANRSQLRVSASYHLPTARNAPDVLPVVGDTITLDMLPELEAAVRTQLSDVCVANDLNRSRVLRSYMSEHHWRSIILLPLTVALTTETTISEVIGLALAIEGRVERRFTESDVQMGEALCSQIASALRQAKLYDDVRELEALKSEMIRMASHDIRNPLSSVMISLELMFPRGRTQSMSIADQEYIASIRNSLGTIKTLLEDLLTLDRVESERQSSWQVTDLAGLVNQVVESAQTNAMIKSQILDYLPPFGEFRVLGSSTQLRQAISNLIDNAIKYTPERGLVDIRLFSKDKRLIFEVRDNGYGIAKERQKRLFQRFYRAREPGTDHIGGTGLGLSLVKAVIERHNGEVWVHSEAGIGSTFGFWLPTYDSEHAPKIERPAEKPTEKPAEKPPEKAAEKPAEKPEETIVAKPVGSVATEKPVTDPAAPSATSIIAEKTSENPAEQPPAPPKV